MAIGTLLLRSHLIPLPMAIGTLLLRSHLIPLPMAIGTLLLEEKGWKNQIFGFLSPSPQGEGFRVRCMPRRGI
jgi:hypothetical protein